MEKLEIVKVKDYDNQGGMLPQDALKALAKRNLRPFTKAEWKSKEAISDAEMDALYPYTPVLLQESDGLLARYYDGFGGDGRDVVCYCVPSDRYGVVGTPIGKAKPHKHVFKCECGATRKV